MYSLQGLIFDVDGTLSDTEEMHRQAFNLAFERAGLDWHWDRTLYPKLLATSGGYERILRYAREVAPELALSPDFNQKVVTLHRAKTSLYQALLRDGRLRLRPGVERLILEARGAGLSLGIATSSAWSNLKTLLDNNLARDWSSWFAAIETCDTVECKKPSPAVYQAVLKRMQLVGSSCIAFEDTQNGLHAARGAGLMTVITTHTFTADDCFDGAAIVLDSLGDNESPMQILRGRRSNAAYVDLNFLEDLHSQHADVGSTTLWEQNQIAFA
jgi:HAD superfamily hydrolase (TIGR01509 family)